MTATTDDELLERLGTCLLADPVRPGAAERAALRRALDDSAPVASVVSLHTRRPWRRIRRPVAATIAVTILLSGSAAAAVETNTLPGPLRSLAVTLGLPVSPSAFMEAQNALSDLTRALAARDPLLVRADLANLEAALSQLSPSARAELGPDVAGLVAQAEIFLAAQPGAAWGTRAAAGSRGGAGDRDSATDDATGVHASSGRAAGVSAETNDSDGLGSGSTTQAGAGTPSATTSSGPSDGDDVSGGAVATSSPTPTGAGGTSSGDSSGGSTSTSTTSPGGTSSGSGTSDGSGTSGGSDGSGGSVSLDGSDGGSGGSDDGGSGS
jgi:hypothetical protein